MGPWSRSFVAAIVGRAEGPSDARRDTVRDITVGVGTIRAEVDGCTVSLTAAPVPPRIWSAMSRYARGRGQLEEAVEGSTQSVHLEHLMAADWDEPLIPRPSAITRTCTCDEGNACEHIVTLAYAFAEEIDADPSQLLRWRGCVDDAPEVDDAPTAPDAVSEVVDPWHGGPLPEPSAVRALPVGAVLKRLGPSGVQVGDEDLADVLERAYATFVSR